MLQFSRVTKSCICVKSPVNSVGVHVQVNILKVLHLKINIIKNHFLYNSTWLPSLYLQIYFSISILLIDLPTTSGICSTKQTKINRAMLVLHSSLTGKLRTNNVLSHVSFTLKCNLLLKQWLNNVFGLLNLILTNWCIQIRRLTTCTVFICKPVMHRTLCKNVD